MADGFHVDILEVGEVVVVALVGELDIATIPELRRRMSEVRALDPGSTVVDAAGLECVDARGMRALTSELSALRHSRRSVATVNIRPNIREVARLLRAEVQLGVASSHQ